MKGFLPWLRRHAVLLMLGVVGLCGRASAQAVSASDTLTVRQDTTAAADTAHKKWLHRMIDKYSAAFSPKDGKKHLFTLSLTDVRANLKWGMTDISPVAGFNVLNMKYGFGVNTARTINNVRYEAGGFIQGHAWKSADRDVYSQLYLRGTFNIKAPKGNTDKIRRLIVETGVFKHNSDTPDGAAYLYGTYEKSIPKWIFFGKLDRDKTVMMSSYAQYRYLADFSDKRFSYGFRGNMLKPFDVVLFKTIHINGRVGPRVNWDSRDGFTYGIELIRYFRKFNPSPMKKTLSSKAGSNAAP